MALETVYFFIHT
jgi:hypothetical protein